MQEGADRKPTATWPRPRNCCASRAAPRRPRPPAAWRPKASSARISRRTASSRAMVEVNCETDFVSRNEDFVAFAKELAQLVAEKNPADVAALAALPLDGGTVESVRAGAGAEDRREHVDPPLRAVHHAGAARAVPARRRPRRRHGRIRRRRRAVGKDIAMHIAASRRRAHPPGLRVARPRFRPT